MITTLEAMDVFFNSRDIYSIEGQDGVKNFSTLTKALGYSSIGDFLIDNPGAVEALIVWIGKQNNHDWVGSLLK